MKELIKRVLRESTNLQSAYNIVMTSSIGDIISESDVYQYVQKIHNNYDDFIEGNLGERIERFSKYKVALIDIDNIVTDEYYLDDDMMNDYIEEYKNNKIYPPIVLGYYDNRWGYDIIDGNHRANALKSIGIKKIKCLVGLNENQKNIYESEINKKGELINFNFGMIPYPFDKIGEFIKWFQDEWGEYAAKQGWGVFDSDSEIPNNKYHSERKDSITGKILNGYYWQVQRLDDPNENEALFGKLKNDYVADDMARKLGLMVDEYGVVYGWKNKNFLDD